MIESFGFKQRIVTSCGTWAVAAEAGTGSADPADFVFVRLGFLVGDLFHQPLLGSYRGGVAGLAVAVVMLP